MTECMSTRIGRSLFCAIVLSVLVVGIAAAEEPYRYVTSWQFTIPGQGGEQVPEGIAIDKAGTLFVGAVGQNAIMKYSSDGTYLGMISGSGDYTMEWPMHLAFDSAGNLYVSDHIDIDQGSSGTIHYYNNDDRVLKITPSGTFSEVPVVGGYFRIAGLTVDSADRLYVSLNPDTYSMDDQIQVFSPSGAYQTTFYTAKEGSGQLATGKDGRIYLLDQYNDQFTAFTQSGERAANWKVKGVTSSAVFMPEGLAVGPDGNIFVVDSLGDNGVLKFTPSGALLTHWGTEGTTPGNFDGADFVATDASGNVYVSDGYNNRIQKFAPAGASQPPVTISPINPVVQPPMGSTYAQARDYYVQAAGAWSQAWGASDFVLIRQYLNQAKTLYTSSLYTANAVNDPANAANLALVKAVSTAYIGLADAALAMYDAADAYGAGQAQINAGSYAAATVSFQTAAEKDERSKSLFNEATTTLQSVSYTGTEYGDGTAYTAAIVPILNGKAAYVGDYATYARAWQHTALALQARAADDDATFRSEANQAMALFGSLRASQSFGTDATTNYNILVGMIGSATQGPTPVVTTVATPKPTVVQTSATPTVIKPTTTKPTPKPTVKPTTKATVKPTTKPTVKPTTKTTVKPTTTPQSEYQHSWDWSYNPSKLGATSGSQVAWKWDFGDGGTSTSKSGVHRYTREGYWTVKLRVTYSDGSTRSFSYSIHTWID